MTAVLSENKPSPLSPIVVPSLGQLPTTLQAQRLVSLLGKQTVLDPNTGAVTLNQPLVDALVQQREAALAPLYRYMAEATNPLGLYEGLYTLQRMKEAKVTGVDRFYGMVSRRLDPTPNALLQIGLAHFYGALDTTCPFGSIVAHLQAATTRSTTSLAQRNLDPTEAWGHALGDQLARLTAKDVVRRLLPLLKANGWTIPPGYEQTLATSQQDLGARLQQGQQTWLA